MINNNCEYLITYDITDNKIRNKVFDKLKDYGLLDIQKSVFFGALNKAELNSLKRYLSKMIINGDKCIIIQSNILKQMNDFSIGYNLDTLNIYKEWSFV